MSRFLDRACLALLMISCGVNLYENHLLQKRLRLAHETNTALQHTLLQRLIVCDPTPYTISTPAANR